MLTSILFHIILCITVFMAFRRRIWGVFAGIGCYFVGVYNERLFPGNRHVPLDGEGAFWFLFLFLVLTLVVLDFRTTQSPSRS